MNVIHLPTSVGGNAWGLSRGERKQGLKSDVLYAEPDLFGYPCDIRIPYSRFWPYRYLKRAYAFLKFLRRYDVFHFNYGKTLFDWFGVLDNLELPLLHSKKICVTYNGCDARQKFKTIKREEICCCKYENCYNGVCNSIDMDRIKEKRIAKFKKFHASFFSLNPDLMHFLPEDTIFLPYTISSWDSIKQADNTVEKRRILRVVHAPTDRVVKGTESIIRAVGAINNRRPSSVELVLVENMPNSEAIKEYRNADIVVDQLRIGWYGGFAVEVMKMGKPVIAYINEKDLRFIPREMARDCKESIINANEFNIEEVLSRYVEDRKQLIIKGEAQMEYVNKWHNPKYVASITKKKYEEM